MLKMFEALVNLVISVLYVINVLEIYGLTNNWMHAVNVTYSADEVLDIRSCQSVLSCARRCLHLNDCYVLEYQEDVSMCVILKSASLVNESSKNRIHYIKAVNCSQDGLSSYIMTNATYTALECQSLCVNLHGYLATVQSFEESQCLNDMRNESSIWIGGMTKDGGANWTWVNGEPWEYTLWRPTEPTILQNDYLRSCVGYYTSYTKWDDHPCQHGQRRCMCEKNFILP